MHFLYSLLVDGRIILQLLKTENRNRLWYFSSPFPPQLVSQVARTLPHECPSDGLLAAPWPPHDLPLASPWQSLSTILAESLSAAAEPTTTQVLSYVIPGTLRGGCWDPYCTRVPFPHSTFPTMQGCIFSAPSHCPGQLPLLAFLFLPSRGLPTWLHFCGRLPHCRSTSTSWDPRKPLRGQSAMERPPRPTAQMVIPAPPER